MQKQCIYALFLIAGLQSKIIWYDVHKADHNFPTWFLAGLYASLITVSTKLVQVSYIFYYCYLVLELSYLTLYM